MLKNDSAQVQMHFVSGNKSLVPVSLPETSVRIVQRMRLEPNQLEQVSKRMKVSQVGSVQVYIQSITSL